MIYVHMMNVPLKQMNEFRYSKGLQPVEKTPVELFGHFESLTVNDTYQFTDYSKYVASAFDLTRKEQVRKEQFSEGCNKAFELGQRCAEYLNLTK